MNKLSHVGGSWSSLLTEWQAQCHDFGEDFETFLPVTLPMLAEQVHQCESEPHSGVFAHVGDDGCTDAVLFANGAFIPGYSHRVLRVRHLLLAPKYDFKDFSEVEFAALLTNVFMSILELSNTDIVCGSIKIHLRSPAEIALFREFSDIVDRADLFSSVKMVGAWLMVTKK